MEKRGDGRGEKKNGKSEKELQKDEWHMTYLVVIIVIGFLIHSVLITHPNIMIFILMFLYFIYFNNFIING